MKRILSILAWLVSAIVAMAQSAQSNYVVSRTYLDDNASQCIEQIAYFDGLGRLSETVSRGITPSGADLITLTEYEGLSRDVRTWLPVPYSANGNMVYDANNYITSVSYNSLNLPSKITYDDGSYITYSYTSNGTKVRTDYYKKSFYIARPPRRILSVLRPIVIKLTYTEYCGNHIFENGELKMTLVDGGFVTYADGTPEYHYYIRDHQGNNRLVVDAYGVVEQVNDYTPFGVSMHNSFAATSDQRYKYNGKELDRMLGLDLYDYGARMYDARIARWLVPDPLSEKYYSTSPYTYCLNNPIRLIDPDGKEVWLFATGLPDFPTKHGATHTFLVVNSSDGKVKKYAAYGPENGGWFGNDKLTRLSYPQDRQVYKDFFKGIDNDNLKGQPQKVNVPNGMTSNEFDQKVIHTINSFGNHDEINYNILGIGKTSGNCNTSSSTILIKAGVSSSEMESLESNIEGIHTGFQTTSPKPWTKEEQEKAVFEAKQFLSKLIELIYLIR